MKLKRNILVGITIGIMLIIFLALYLYKSGDICHNDPLSYYDSPTHVHEVIHGIKDCYNVDVNISPVINWVTVDNKEVLSFDSKLQGVDVEWINDSELHITMPAHAQFLHENLNVIKGVDIVILTTQYII